MRVGRGLFEASSRVARVVLGDLRWRKLEERREGTKLWFGKRLVQIEESRLV